MRFEVTNTKAGEPSWWLYFGSDMVAWAGETFARTSNATRAAEASKMGASTAQYDVSEDAGGECRWRAWRSSDKVASSGEAFASKFNAERAAANVRDNAGNAESP